MVAYAQGLASLTPLYSTLSYVFPFDVNATSDLTSWTRTPHAQARVLILIEDIVNRVTGRIRQRT